MNPSVSSTSSSMTTTARVRSAGWTHAIQRHRHTLLPWMYRPRRPFASEIMTDDDAFSIRRAGCRELELESIEDVGCRRGSVIRNRKKDEEDDGLDRKRFKRWKAYPMRLTRTPARCQAAAATPSCTSSTKHSTKPIQGRARHMIERR